jgi:hypothetical protein
VAAASLRLALKAEFARSHIVLRKLRIVCAIALATLAPAAFAQHGAISTGPADNRVYFGCGTNKNGVLQIADRAKLLAGPMIARGPGPQLAELRHGQHGRAGKGAVA